MPATWVTVLQLVPWGEVIKNAPKVADGAVKLWNSVSGKTPPEAPPMEPASVSSLAEADALVRLESQLQEARGAVSELQGQVLQSAEVIRELASQNTQLVAQVEANRKAVTVLGMAVALLVLVAVVQALV